MVLTTCLIVTDLDLMMKARGKNFEDITFEDFKLLEPTLSESIDVVIFRDYRKKYRGNYQSRQKIVKVPRVIKSRYSK